MVFGNKSIILMAALFAGFANPGCIDNSADRPNDDNTGWVESGLSPDGMPNDKDSCPDLSNPPTYELGMSCDTEHDCTDVPVACEDPNDPSWDTCEPVWVGCINHQCRTQPNNDWDEYGDPCDPDDDEDDVCDPGIFPEPLSNALIIPVDCEGSDNCQWDWNPDQTNTDWLLSQEDNSTVVGDEWGDACDDDDDNDNVTDGSDNCRLVPNTDQVNTDGDDDGDACDNDDDNDGDADDNDTCPWDWDPWQEDNDDDGEPGVGGGDVCDDDDDDDNVTDDEDNCHYLANTDQHDQDGDGRGDVCDVDCDNDGVAEVDEEDLPNPFCGDACEEDVDCDDEIECTVDSCNEDTGVCTHVNECNECVENTACDDGVNCTENDWCVEGECVGEVRLCDDLNACTTDSCDEQLGCVNTPLVAINDNNVCTDDACNSANGVITHVNNSAPCNDNLWCNGVDTCGGGSCSVHGVNPCSLNTTDNNCATSCQESNDTCTAADPNGTGCNDGNSCTSGDQCTGGVCGGTLTQQCGVDADFDGYTACLSIPNGTCDCDDGGTSGGAPASYCRTGSDGFLVVAWAAAYGSRPACPGGSTLVGATDGSFLNGPQIAGHETGGDSFDNDCDGSTDEAEPGLDNCTFVGLGGGVTRVDCPWMDTAPTLPPL